MKKMLLRFSGTDRPQDVFHTLRREENGAVMVLVAAGMVILLGFGALVLDLGMVYHQTARLQNALDSAVLAAVQELPAAGLSDPAWTAAKSKAGSLAAANNLTLSGADLTPVYEGGDTSRRIVGIKAAQSVTVDYAFARVLGVSSGTAARTATAKLSLPGGLKGLVPLSITSDSLATAIADGNIANLTIKCSSKKEDIGIIAGSGWFGAMQYQGSGANVYKDLLKSGYGGEVHINQVLQMENGNMSGPTLAGVTPRFTGHGSCTAANHEPDCPRAVYVPVVITEPTEKYPQPLGNKEVRVTSFAAFFLESYGGNGSNSYIKATYLPEVVLPNTVGGGGTEDFGIYVTRLSD